MILYVDNILQTCKATDLHDQIVKIFNLGSYLLHRWRKSAAKELLRQVELTFSKLKFRTNLEDIWKEDHSLIAHSVNNGNGGTDVIINYGHSEVKVGLESYDFLLSLSILEAEIDQVLQEFRKSYELEYKVVEETLQAQKTHLQKLYQQLEYEKCIDWSKLTNNCIRGLISCCKRKKEIDTSGAGQV